MRKLVLALLLIGAVTLPIAAEVTFGGDITFGAIWDFVDPNGATVGTSTVATTKTATVDVKAAIDDYTAGRVSVRFDDSTNGTLVGGIEVEEVYIQFKPLAALMLDMPLALTMYFGYDSASDNDYVEFGSYGVEDDSVANAGLGTDWIIWGDLVLVDLITVRFGLEPGSANEFLVGAFLSQTIGEGMSVSAEVFYDNGVGNEIGKGVLNVDGNFKMAAGDISLGVGAGIGVNLAATTNNFYYALGAEVVYSSLLNVGFGIEGGGGETFNEAAVDVTLTPAELMDAYVGAQFDLRSATGVTLFQGADVGVKLNLGKMDLYAGYLITTVGNGEWNAIATTNGGLYIKADVDY
jgi:hypothetical protein